MTLVAAAVGSIAGWTLTTTVLRRAFVDDRTRLSARRAAVFAGTAWLG